MSFMEEKRSPGISTAMQYRFTFRPGRYKYVDSAVTGMPQSAVMTARGSRCYLIGREEDGVTVAFTFEENHAAQMCFGLNILDALAKGDSNEVSTIMKQFEKLKKS